jgi:hypothetical protein
MGDKKKFKGYAKSYMISIMVMSFLVCFFFCLNYIILVLSDDIQNINYVIALESNVNNNNLTLPYPNFNQDLIGYQSVKDYMRDAYENKSVAEYMDFISEIYFYDERYDCKYWAFVHSQYFVIVKDKYNYNLKYITTRNHIFVMLYNETGYCILDGKEYLCLEE